MDHIMYSSLPPKYAPWTWEERAYLASRSHLDQQILSLGIELQVLSGVGSTDTDRKNNILVVERVTEETLGFLVSWKS
jgi:hypothetical protein